MNSNTLSSKNARNPMKTATETTILRNLDVHEDMNHVGYPLFLN